LVKVYVSVAVACNADDRPLTGAAEKAEVLPARARMRADAIASFMVVCILILLNMTHGGEE